MKQILKLIPKYQCEELKTAVISRQDMCQLCIQDLQ